MQYIVTYNSIKKILATDLSKEEDLIKLQKIKINLIDARNMLVKYEDYGLTKESLERGFIQILKCDGDVNGVFKNIAPRELFLEQNINCKLKEVEQRLNKLY